jgi:hypothetical protein
LWPAPARCSARSFTLHSVDEAYTEFRDLVLCELGHRRFFL